MRRLILAVALVLVPGAAQAQTSPTIRDVVELTKAGLGEDVLLALIEVHRPVFPVDTETLKMLKAAGVAPRVIVAMVKSGREPLPVPVAVPEPEVAAEPQPQVVVIDHHEPRDEPRVREVAVPVPVYVPVRSHRSRDSYPRRDDDDYVRPQPKPAAPVYWGWGGKLRPDAWKPSPEPAKPKTPEKAPDKK